MSPLMSFSAQYLYEEFPHCPLLCTFCFVYLLFRSQIDHGIDLAFLYNLLNCQNVVTQDLQEFISSSYTLAITIIIDFTKLI